MNRAETLVSYDFHFPGGKMGSELANTRMMNILSSSKGRRKKTKQNMVIGGLREVWLA